MIKKTKIEKDIDQKEFRITYRVEVYLKANDEKEALEEFVNMDWNELIKKSSYVERVSIDEEC